MLLTFSIKILFRFALMQWLKLMFIFQKRKWFLATEAMQWKLKRIIRRGLIEEDVVVKKGAEGSSSHICCCPTHRSRALASTDRASHIILDYLQSFNAKIRT